MSAKEKLQRLKAVEEAPPPAADPFDKLAARVNGKTSDDQEEVKFRTSRAFKMELKRLAAITGYTTNGLMQLMLENGVEELNARIKAGKATNDAT